MGIIYTKRIIFYNISSSQCGENTKKIHIESGDIVCDDVGAKHKSESLSIFFFDKELTIMKLPTLELSGYIGKQGTISFSVPLKHQAAEINSMRAVPTCDHSELLLDVVFSCKLGQIVHEPTRVSTNSRSLLDLVVLSESVQRLGFDVNVLPGISDHEIVQFKSHMLPSTSRAIIKPFRDFNSADNESILDFLELDFDTFRSKYNNGYPDVNGLWLHFKTAVHTCINKYVPQKQRKINRQSPWITRDIIHLKRHVKRLSRAPKTPNVLPSLRADLRKKIKESKYHFFNVKMHGFLVTNPKKFWTHITQKKDPVGKIKIDDREVSDACSIARAFKAFFLVCICTCNPVLH